MSEDGHLPWTAEQWAEMQQLVQASARRARVAGSFLPLFGPLPPGQATVPALGMTDQQIDGPLERGEPDLRLDIDDGATLRLTTIACDVYVKSQQAEDPSLAAVRDLIGRAGDIIGRLEDAIVFHGQPEAHTAPGQPQNGQQSPFVQPYIYRVRNGQQNPGLLTAPARIPMVGIVRGASYNRLGENLVPAVIDAIQALEAQGHYGPFACVLGQGFYRGATTPNPNSLVLPSDRITPFLDGPLHRSSVMGQDQGVVVALAGSPVDLVVAKDVHIGFLQRSLEPRYVLRVAERFVLRIKQPEAIYRLEVGDESLGALGLQRTVYP
jgi:uncharacterized linocin/CFP29 family protein